MSSIYSGRPNKIRNLIVTKSICIFSNQPDNYDLLKCSIAAYPCATGSNAVRYVQENFRRVLSQSCLERASCAMQALISKVQTRNPEKYC